MSRAFNMQSKNPMSKTRDILLKTEGQNVPSFHNAKLKSYVKSAGHFVKNNGTKCPAKTARILKNCKIDT